MLNQKPPPPPCLILGTPFLRCLGMSYILRTCACSTHRSNILSAVASQIYSDISGAKLVNDPNLSSIWTVPCDVEINISFNIGGKNFPIHPLDTSMDLGNTDARGNKICYGGVRSFYAGYDLPLISLMTVSAYIRRWGITNVRHDPRHGIP